MLPSTFFECLYYTLDFCFMAHPKSCDYVHYFTLEYLPIDCKFCEEKSYIYHYNSITYSCLRVEAQ